MSEETIEEMESVVDSAIEEATILGNALIEMIIPYCNTQKKSQIAGLSLILMLIAIRRSMMPATSLEEIIEAMRSLDHTEARIVFLPTVFSQSEH